MRGSVLVLVVAAGCGRLGFDAPRGDGGAPGGDGGAPGGDATLVGHDEDGDGLDDALDPCPHLPEATPDGDDDGVGDACDPNPGNPGEFFKVFATMRPGDQPFTLGGPWTQAADAIVTDGATYAYLDYVYDLTNVRVVVGMEVTPVGGGFHQVALGGDDAAAIGYFIEVQDTAGAGNAQIVFDDAGTFAPVRQAPLASGVRAGDLRLDVTYRAGATPEVRAEMGWPGELYQVQAAAPAYAGMDDVRLGQNNVGLEVRYVAVIHSP